jgi:hypothetical protein
VLDWVQCNVENLLMEREGRAACAGAGARNSARGSPLELLDAMKVSGDAGLHPSRA